MLKLIDSHCHPQFPQYDSDREVIIARALGSGIGMVCVGTNLVSSQKAVELAAAHEAIWATVGVHPTESGDIALSQLRELAENPKVVAIGEVGLDYYHVEDSGAREEQKKKFAKFAELALQVKKPLVIHCRDSLQSSQDQPGAHQDMLELLPEHPGVIHSFNGSSEQAALYVSRGYYIGLNAIVTFSEKYSPMVRSIPLERILLETDAPYLAPAPNRGKRNEPAYILETAQLIAEIRGESMDDLIFASFTNPKRLFGVE